jgi:ketopantoate hydroxymethyltransferase
MNVLDFQKMKEQGRKISMVTCYDYSSARAVAESSIDCILVGDSLAMTMHGFPNTLPATTAMIALHTAAVARGAPSKFIVADLPFLSYRKGLKEAECFALVLECVPSGAAREVTGILTIPTIGIGAGPSVSGQVLVYQDLIGLKPGFKPKFLRTYANAFEVIQTALNAYDYDVKAGQFPSEAESYSESHPAGSHTSKRADGVLSIQYRNGAEDGRALREQVPA